ncbi:imelysin family protein [Mesorhizobium sp. CAU 1732]|uniref:imelysin family protein n=1 Tax=Mesorhizobium sp. CAU 1732 TaxID=3140358 RepID=UPI0032619849
MVRLTVFLIAAITALPAFAQVGPGTAVAETFARPALEALATTAQETASSVEALCVAPAQTNLDETRAEFGDLVRAFGRASVLRFGPLAADNRFERLFFWPDPRGTALKQVQAALAADDGGTTPEDIAGKSVALQGLPALEFVLFGTSSDDLARTGHDVRCTFAHAIAVNIATMSTDAMQGWAADTAFSRAFEMPSADTEPYRTAGEVDGEIVKALATIFQFVRAAELQPALGKDVDAANGRRAPLWRSDLSFGLVAAQLEGARDLLAAANYAQTLPQDTRFIADSIRFELDSTIRVLGEIAEPAETAFGSERARIGFADIAIDHAGHLVSEELAAALGLTMGFNALDGD